MLLRHQGKNLINFTTILDPMQDITRENIGEVSIVTLDGMNKAFYPTPTILEELPTGFGKTKVAIDLINHICKREYLKNYSSNDESHTINVLLLVAKRVHKQTWCDEIVKWGGLGYKSVGVNLVIECYESLKNYENNYFEIAVLDELHHIGSDLRLDLLKTLTITELLLGLSATIPYDLRKWFRYQYNAKVISCTLQEAFDTETLPEPVIYLFPLRFITPEHTKNGQVAHLRRLDSAIEKFKNAYMNDNQSWRKLKWLRACKDRLEFLSRCKNDILKRMLGWLDKERTLTFCSSIAQTEVLGSNCIHSKNKNSVQVLEDFNAGKIDHITSCQVLNEGVNLTNCRVGIYANISASDIVTRQRLGRILRHPSPMVIIPYYIGTREEELVNKMIGEYDPSLVKNIRELFNTYDPDDSDDFYTNYHHIDNIDTEDIEDTEF